MAFLNAALSAIPSVAGSKYSLIAYALAIGAYVFFVWRVTRNKNLLKSIEKLPARDRLSALEIEMGGVRLARGISPEQWLRSRIHRYYFLAFVVACLLVLGILLISLLVAAGKIDVAVDLYDPASTRQRDNANYSPVAIPGARADGSDFSGVTSSQEKIGSGGLLSNDDAWQTTYLYEKADGIIRIKPLLPYLTDENRTRVFSGRDFWKSDLQGTQPLLSVRVVNNSRETLLLTEMELTVAASEIDERPIITPLAGSYRGQLVFLNQGWGPVLDPSLKYSIRPIGECKDRFALTSPITPKLDPFDASTSISIKESVPQELIDKTKQCEKTISYICAEDFCSDLNDPTIQCLDTKQDQRCLTVNKVASRYVDRFLENPDLKDRLKGRPPKIHYERACSKTPICINAELSYKDKLGKSRISRFATYVYLDPQESHGALPPSQTYDVFLIAGRVGTTVRKATSQQIRPGDADQFLVRIFSNKSATYKFQLAIRDAGAAIVWQGDFEMGILAPRTSH
ncbi:hypothetical protein TSA1_29930 [Bradyrhizobium nitroreducens]|uniref:Uncharacterized protein n=1 Tax=Bradyrhizobium nitroreducens TaxID=709803 RepID=A0A2M6UIR8_9BRAD|nr:hypothetical protein [Bradyrhizobium nitroreducens]PIT04503.1 hypothetical protein TSA1_29930 [Bradyrhizobium nitroreducens]